MSALSCCVALWLCLSPLAVVAQELPPLTPPKQEGPLRPEPQSPQQSLQPLREKRYGYPVRLGGIFTLGLGEGGDLDASAHNKTSLSEADQRWLLAYCDVAAFSHRNVTPTHFAALTKANPLFTPLLFFYASTLSELPDAHGSVGGWRPEMTAWILRRDDGHPVSHPDAQSHWMAFGSQPWAEHWRDRVQEWVHRYGAQGVVAAELPVGNTFVSEEVGKYARPESRAELTETWLRAARAPGRFLMIPSTLGFDTLAPHPTQPTPPGTEQRGLAGRLWDQYYPYMDGGWAEGWIRPYWADGPVPEGVWKLHLEAADRAANSGQVFIACAAFRNVRELEFALASYLLVWHRQGRLVFQPMPLLPFVRPDIGYSLAMQKRLVATYKRYFDVPLGAALQERLPVSAEGGAVWKRAFTGGVVYVNSSDRNGIRFGLSGSMERVTGEQVREVELGPQEGVILLYSRIAAQ